MTRYHLKDLTIARMYGFTDVFKLTNTDLTQSANNTQQSVNLTTLNLGDIVNQEVLLEVRTASTGLATCTASVGVTGAVTQLIGASDCVAGNLYFVPTGSTASYPTIAAGKSLLVNFTPGASEALNACTALELYVWCSITRLTDRNTIQF